MKGISVRQPWAWSIIHGGKDVENRSRNIAGSYRGPVAIHASKTVDEDALDYHSPMAGLFGWSCPDRGKHSHNTRLCEKCAERRAIEREKSWLGGIVGVVDLVGVHDSQHCWAAGFGRVRDLFFGDREAFDALPDSGAGGVAGKVCLCSPWALHNEVHLVLANPRPLPELVPCRGALGLWTVPDDVVARLVLDSGDDR